MVTITKIYLANATIQISTNIQMIIVSIKNNTNGVAELEFCSSYILECYFPTTCYNFHVSFLLEKKNKTKFKWGYYVPSINVRTDDIDEMWNAQQMQKSAHSQ